MILVGRADEEELLNFIPEKKGSLVTYFGYVRDHANGKKVKRMQCKEKEDSRKIMEEIEKEIKGRFPVESLILYHSVGELKVEDLLAAVLVSTVHRKEGFEACRLGIELIKEREPLRRREF